MQILLIAERNADQAAIFHASPRTDLGVTLESDVTRAHELLKASEFDALVVDWKIAQQHGRDLLASAHSHSRRLNFAIAWMGTSVGETEAAMRMGFDIAQIGAVDVGELAEVLGFVRIRPEGTTTPPKPKDPTPTNIPPVGSPLRFLVVDDDRAAQVILDRAVSKLGHETLLASDGAQAIAALTSDSHIDAILADWEMPGVDGLELCRQVRMLSGPYRYFAMVTSARGRQAYSTAMAAGADAFLTKPLDFHELERVVDAAALIARLHRSLNRAKSRNIG